MKHLIAILIFLFSISNLNAQTKRIYASFGHCKSRDYEKYHFKYDTMSLTDFKKVKKLKLNGFENDSNCKFSKAIFIYLAKRGFGHELTITSSDFFNLKEYQDWIKSINFGGKIYIDLIEFICNDEIIKIEGSIDISINKE